MPPSCAPSSASATTSTCKIVAEGVESLEQLQFLRGERCDLVQGFLLSRAVPAASFMELVRAAQPAAVGDIGALRNAGAHG